MKAKDLLLKGDVVGAYETIVADVSKHLLQSECPGCTSPTTILQKSGHESGECSKCGATWGKRAAAPIGTLVKSGRNEGNSVSSRYEKGRPDVIEKLWSFWRTTGGEGVPAQEINKYAITGIIAKSLLNKIGIFPSDAEAGEELVKSEPIAKSEDEPTWGGLSKNLFAAKMLEMYKSGEEPQIIHRNSLTKFEVFGEANEDVVKAVLTKAGIDTNTLLKGKPVPKLEDGDGIDPDIEDPGKGPREEPKARFGRQQQPVTPKPLGSLGQDYVMRLVTDNPANGAGEKMGKSAVDVGTPAAPSQKNLGQHFIFSSEKPAFPDKRTVNSSHEQVLHGLRREGMDAREAKGKYGGQHERSIIVHNPKPHDIHTLHSLAGGLGQESAIHSDGENHRLYYYHGQHAGKHVDGRGTSWAENEPEDNFTEISEPDSGQRSWFSHHFNWDQIHDHVDDGTPKADERSEVVKSEAFAGIADALAKFDALQKTDKSLAPAPDAPKGKDVLIKKPMQKAKVDTRIHGKTGASQDFLGVKAQAKRTDRAKRSSALEESYEVKLPKGRDRSHPDYYSDMAAGKTVQKADSRKSHGEFVDQFMADLPKADRSKSGTDPKAKQAKAPPGFEGTPREYWGKPMGKPLDPTNPFKKSDEVVKAAGAPPAPMATMKPLKPVKPVALPKAPNPGASAKPITTPVAPKGTVAKSKDDFPLVGSDASTQAKIDVGTHGVSATAKPAEAPKKKFDPASIGIHPGSGKKMIKPATKTLTKSDALAYVEQKMSDLRKSSTPTTHTELRHYAELGTKISLMPGDSVTLSELD